MKKTILGVVLGIVIGATTTVVASTLLASNVSYTPKDKNWKVSNVEDAIDDLYSNGGGKTIELQMHINQSLQLILPNCTLETTNSKVVTIGNDSTINAVGMGNVKVKVIDSNSKVLLIYDITVTYTQPIEFYATSDSDVSSSSIQGTSQAVADSISKYLFDGNATNRQGSYGALLIGGYKAYFKVYDRVNVSFSSTYYSDSGGTTGKNAVFYKKDSSGNYVEYYTLTQSNNSQNYGKYLFEPGEYYVKASNRYVQFEEWNVEKA